MIAATVSVVKTAFKEKTKSISIKRVTATQAQSRAGTDATRSQNSRKARTVSR